MDSYQSSRDRNNEGLRYDSEDTNFSAENVEIEELIEEIYGAEENARRCSTQVTLPSCSCDTKPVIDDEQPGPSGLQPPVDRSLRDGNFLYTMFHRPNGKLPAADDDYYLSSSDSEDEGPDSREWFKKQQEMKGFLQDDTPLYSTDPRFSDSYGDQDPFDGPSNGPSNDPPEPEWPKDVPIRKGDILYMMFQRPENDKEANTAHEKPMKRSATERDGAVERSSGEIIKRFKDDLETVQTYSPEVRLSNSCFEQQQIAEDMPRRSRSEFAVAASDMDPDLIYMLHGPPDVARPSAYNKTSPDIDFWASPSLSDDAHWYLRKPSCNMSLMAWNGSQHSSNNDLCSNGYRMLPEWPSRKDIIAKKPATTKINHKNLLSSASQSPDNNATFRGHRKRKHDPDRNEIVINNESKVYLSHSDNSVLSSKRMREENETDSSSKYEELVELSAMDVDLPQGDPESLVYFQREMHPKNTKYEYKKGTTDMMAT